MILTDNIERALRDIVEKSLESIVKTQEDIFEQREKIAYAEEVYKEYKEYREMPFYKKIYENIFKRIETRIKKKRLQDIKNNRETEVFVYREYYRNVNNKLNNLRITLKEGTGYLREDVVDRLTKGYEYLRSIRENIAIYLVTLEEKERVYYKIKQTR